MASPKSSKMEVDNDSDAENTSQTNVASSASSSRKKCNKENLMWIEKYRPNTLDGIISHTNIIETVNQLVNARKMPHLLFYGPPGTGKTTTILACARQLNGANWQSMTLELNASDERGIDVMRNRIKTFASTQQIFATGFKLVILDEADAMTNAAQFALRRIIEKYTKNTRFCLICNYVNKIIPALQSRCTKFRFAPLDRIAVENHLQSVAKDENVNLTKDGLKAIVHISEGDMRKCLNILQATHRAHSVVDEAAVHLVTGAPLPADINQILKLLLNKDFEDALDGVSAIQNAKGLALTDILGSLHRIIIQMKLDPTVLCELLSAMSDLEHRLTVATNDRIQLASLIGMFQIVRHSSFTAHRRSTQQS